jgi:glycosyltransferase involved in cell wall biosynthesis
MNVLMLTAYPPVLDMHGGGVRMYHNIRILSQRHRVRVISFVESEEDRERLNAVREICASVTAVRRRPDFRPHWISLQPFMVYAFNTPEMHQAVDEALLRERVDVLQCEYLQMAQFRRPGPFSILTAHEAVSRNLKQEISSEAEPLRKLRTFYQWMQMLRYEVRETARFDRVVTMTAEDAAYLRSYAKTADIRTIPIGIDLARFSAAAEDPERPTEVLFVGNFRHYPNVEAVGFLLRHVAPLFPQIRFVFPGSHPPAGLAAASNVFFTGHVRDIRELYRRPNTIVMAPLFSGTGQRVKLLEAFAMGCPVVTTTIGAAGFPIRHGREAILANTPVEFSQALTDLASSMEFRRKLGEAGRRMVVDKFGWDRLAEELLGVVEEAAVSR